MKKIVLMLFGAFVTLALSAQPPQRPLPNQFRDFVDHQEKWNTERPQIEKKDGKVIITMSEIQFKRMQMMRKRPPMMMARFQNNRCGKCEMIHRKHLPKRRKI